MGVRSRAVERASNHKEGVDEHVPVERGEGVARVIVVPEAELHGRNDRGVQQQEGAGEHHACARGAAPSRGRLRPAGTARHGGRGAARHGTARGAARRGLALHGTAGAARHS